jgi:polar amino acid transport system substrate-binding protein
MKNYGKTAGLSALLLLAAASAGAGRAREVHEVRMAAQETIPPKWIHTQGAPQGICPDILAAVERTEPRLRFTGTRNSRSLPGIEAGLEAGNLDAACALIPSKRRQSIAVAVGKPVYVVRHLLVVRNGDSAQIRDVRDLAHTGALVTSQRAAVFTDKLKAAGVRVDDATDDNLVNLRKMLAGHGRFAYVNELTLRHYLRAERLEDKVRVLPAALGTEQAYFWVSRKADPALARLLGTALDQLKASGELDRIYTRWAGQP